MGSPEAAASASRPRVAVVIPTLDEEVAIRDVLASVPREAVDEIIVADSGSRDRTVERARAAGARVVVESRRGYGRACATGAGACDFVVGSRLRGTRERGSMSAHQILAGHLAGWAIRLLYGVRYTDMCAFRAIRRDALDRLGMREMTYGWNLEMQMRAARAGLRIREVGVAHRRRAGGASKVSGSLIGTLKASLRIALTFCRVAFEPRLPRGRLGRGATTR